MDKHFAYFLKNFHLFYESEAEIAYGESTDGAVRIAQRVEAAFFESGEDIDPRDVVWRDWNDRAIPFVFDRDDGPEIITEKDGVVHINYDIVAGTFYFLSGWSEMVDSNRDELGRVSYRGSAVQMLYTTYLPAVNYYFDILYQALSRINACTKRDVWGDHRFGVALTHDIDKRNSAWFEGSFSELKRGRPLSIPKLLMKRLRGKDDWNNLDLVAGIDGQYAESSTFFFLSRKGKSGKHANADYDVRERDVRDQIAALRSAGHEIGVHGSFGTHDDSTDLIRDMERIGVDPIVGNRFHFLVFDPRTTVSVLERAGLSYDSSLGFAEHVGFRRGTCYPFYLYNFEENRPSDVLEIPLLVMDATLESRRYMALNPTKAVTTVQHIIDEVVRCNGVFTILWHNTYFSDYKFTGWREVYVQILDSCKEKNGLLTSGKDIYERVTK